MELHSHDPQTTLCEEVSKQEQEPLKLSFTLHLTKYYEHSQNVNVTGKQKMFLS
jgi:hypothetical protein